MFDCAAIREQAGLYWLAARLESDPRARTAFEAMAQSLEKMAERIEAELTANAASV